MRLNVVHETHYTLLQPGGAVATAPAPDAAPATLAGAARPPHQRSSPHPASYDERDDYFGNRTAIALIAAPHRDLLVRASSVVSVAAREKEALARPQVAWEAVREPGSTPAPPSSSTSRRMWRPGASLPTSRRRASPRGRGVLEAALDLAHRIHQDFEFDRTATSVSTPLREVLKRRRGVCQDFAHLMIGCLRANGLPARYVSGYLLTDPPPGRPRLVGADASHAWVSVWCGGAASDAGSRR